MKSNLYHGYTAEQIFKDADEEKRVLEMKEVEREEYIAERVMKLKTEDDTDIVAFSKEELVRLDEYFKGTNAETAYLLGRYCGLRINEAFGLKWDHVNLEEGTCYMQEAMNPEGYAYDDRVYRIDVTDSNRSLDISENEITNTIEFTKFDYDTKEIINGEGKFVVKEYNCVDGQYRTVGPVSYSGDGKYNLSNANTFEWHDIS